MPYRKQQFANNEIYHITIRKIGDDLLFKDINDYYRGIFSIYEFNNTKPITIQYQRKVRAKLKKEKEIVVETDRGPSSIIDRRDRLIDILTFCFMPNHMHLLIKQLKDNGITKFMSKLGTGYGGYFNRKYSQKGYVFQNRFSAVHIETEEQLMAVFAYIHINPISLIEPKWKEKGIQNIETVIEFLENYKWSSYLDYVGTKNFPSVTEREFLLEIIGGEQGCKDFINNWIRYKGKIKEFPEISLEE